MSAAAGFKSIVFRVVSDGDGGRVERTFAAAVPDAEAEEIASERLRHHGDQWPSIFMTARFLTINEKRWLAENNSGFWAGYCSHRRSGSTPTKAAV
ncbi:MAG: hypothetical protein V4498_02590 [candidate division FCPU426 bacterium]